MPDVLLEENPLAKGQSTAAAVTIAQSCPCPRIETFGEKAFIALAGSAPGFVAALLVVAVGYWANTKIEDRKHRNEERRLKAKHEEDRAASSAADARKRFRDALQSIAAAAESCDVALGEYRNRCMDSIISKTLIPPDIPRTSLAQGESAAQVYGTDEILELWNLFDKDYRSAVNSCVAIVSAVNRYRIANPDEQVPASVIDAPHAEYEKFRGTVIKSKASLHAAIRQATKNDRSLAE